jgi:3-hydroxyacyl-CoA dehydrogenase
MAKSLITNNIIKRFYSLSRLNSQKINHVTVVGSGLMGSGIAQVTAQAGYNVTLVDQNDAILNKAVASIKTSLQRSTKKQFEKEPQNAEKFINDVIARISTSTQIDKAVEKTNLVIEAIVENIKVKHELFSRIDKIAPRETILTSNTSSLPIKEIAESVVRKDKFGGLHFFNPV